VPIVSVLELSFEIDLLNIIIRYNIKLDGEHLVRVHYTNEILGWLKYYTFGQRNNVN